MSKTAVGLIALLLLALASCASASATPTSTDRLSDAGVSAATAATTPTLKASVCQGLATIHTSLAKLATEAKNITVGQVKAAQQKIAAAAANLASKIPKSDGPILTKLKAANTNLTNALSAYPDSATLGEVLPAVPGYEKFVTQAQAAQTKLSSKLQCSE